MSYNASIVKIFREFSTRYPKHFSVLFLLLVIEGAVAALSILAIVPMADFLLDPTLTKPSQITQVVNEFLLAIGWVPTFWIFGMIFIVTNILREIIEVLIQYAILRIKYTVMRGLFSDALYTFFKARWAFFSSSEQGKLLNTLNKELSTIGNTLGHIATLFAQIVQLCIYLAVPIWLNAKMTLMATGLALIFAIPFLLLNRVSYRLGKRNTETANILMGILSEVLGAARLILGFGKQKEARRRYLSAFDKHVDVTLKSQILSKAVPKLFKPMAMLSAIVAMGVAAQEGVLFSELGAVMWSLLSALPVLGAILQGNISITNFIPSYEQLIALRKSAIENEEIEGNRNFSRLLNSIELVNVNFTYPGRVQTLSNINIVIRKGKMTALIGESGSGKSTVTDLVLGLQIPNEGHVLIDDVPLNDWKQNSYRQHIGYVPQDPQLFNSSIRENLLWSYENGTEKELWEALDMANAKKFVTDLPDGIDTIVGDRGIRLSGGQRQRIALARAILRKPELLILDEATSALDCESELLIQQSIEQVAHNTTILVVAHRLSTIARADQVYVMQKGNIVEEGSFSELSVKSGGKLNALLAAQLPVEQYC